MKFQVSIPHFIILALLAVVAMAAALPIDVMEIDAAQYATISWEMHESQSYLQLFCNGNDYLDKPPFLFWLNQLFFSLLGVSTVSYKLGNFLFLILGLYSVYKFASYIYNAQTGLVSVLILATTVAWMLMANDVRTDGILASVLVFTVWQWKVYIDTRKWSHLIFTSLGLGVALLTKGPLGFMIPAILVGVDVWAHKNYRRIFDVKYLVMFLLVSLMLAPMVYGLYLQYDLHPGKMINGQKILSGVRFYFWTQSFGRITGESNWNNHTGIGYFIPVILWAFFPWCIFIVQAIAYAVSSGLRKNMMFLAGLFIPLIAFSLSRYKLPHYIFISFPFIAMLVANYLVNKGIVKWERLLLYILQFVCILLIPFIGQQWSVSPAISLGVSTLLIAVYVWVLFSQKKPALHLLLLTLTFLYGFVQLYFWPEVLKYQSSSQAGKAYATLETDASIPFVEVDTWGFATEFYARKEMKFYGSVQEIMDTEPAGWYWIHISDKAYPDLDKLGLKPALEKSLPSYPVSKIKFSFLLKNSRDKVVSKTHLLKVYLP